LRSLDCASQIVGICPGALGSRTFIGGAALKDAALSQLGLLSFLS